MYQQIGISPAGSSGVLVSNMELKLVDEEGKGKKKKAYFFWRGEKKVIIIKRLFI
jgi:hypothetical protein